MGVNILHKGGINMSVLKAGADAGNNGLKLWVKDKEPLSIPTIYSFYLGETTEIMDMDDIPKDQLVNNIDVTINSKALSENGNRYIIGEKVINDNQSPIELEKRSDKSRDEIPVLVTLAGLAVNAMQDQYDQNQIEVTYDLAVALPVQTITKDAAMRNADRYMGTHEVIYHHPSGRDVTVTIKIEYCKCLPEGASAAWGVVYDEKGNLSERKVESGNGITTVNFLNKTLLHFDIGAGTTEIVVTTDVKFNPKLSEGLPYGVKETLLDVIKRWNRKNPLKTIDSIAEFNEIYFDTEHPRHNELIIESTPAIKQLAHRISNSVIDKIDDMKDDPYVFIYGGGSAVLKDSLQAILKSKDRTTNVIFLKDPMYVNARGLLVYACSPRFEQQKEKTLGVAVNGSDKK